MRFVHALAAAIAAAPAAFGQTPPPPAPPAVKLPEAVTAAPGRLMQLKADTTGKVVKWALASEDADLIPYPPDGRVAIFSSPKPGKYVVLAWTAAGDVPSDAARCVVTVADPTPPAPPVPPAPADPLAAELQALYAADTGATKAADAAALGQLYTLMQGEAGKDTYPTAAAVNAKYVSARDSMLGANSLVAIRHRLSTEVTAACPADPDAPITTTDRAKLAAAFGRLAAIVKGLK